MLSLTTVTFIAAGLQFWTISYMQVVLFMDPVDSQITLVVVIFSAMVPGLAMASTLSDYFGGYKGHGLIHALTLLSVFGFMTVVFGLSLSRCFDPDMFICLLWAF